MPNYKDLFFQYIAQTSDSPISLEINSAKGVNLYDSNNKKYIDLISGISVSVIGHSNSKVVKAINQQASKHLHLMVYGEYIQSPQVLLAKKIVTLLNSNLNSVYYVNSGSEAIEGAIKLSKRYTGRKEIIACKNAYHGSTIGAMSLISDENYKHNFEPLMPNVSHIEFNNIESLSLITENTACVIVEPVQGEAGYIKANPDFINALSNKCKSTGTLIVFDEVQSGMCRTGKWFAFQHYNIVPDIIVLAKGFGGGMPLGAFISTSEIMKCLMHNPILGHITTFGGHPVSCAASIATIDVILNDKLCEKVEEKEMLFRALLKHKLISEIRGLGLMLSVEISSWSNVQKVIAYCLKNGIVIDWFLFSNTSLRISPPLTITKAQIKYCCKIILDSLNEIGECR